MQTRDDDVERRWVTAVYQKGARQLTVRAVVAGMLIGGLMCLSNLYVVLKTGWSLGVTLTACIVAFALFKGLSATRVVKGEFTILENNAMGSVASAAGYMTGGGNMAALPALLMLTAIRPSGWAMFFWFVAIAALGVFVAIPIKRQLINREKLAFPTGTATAETLRSLHAVHEGALQSSSSVAPAPPQGTDKARLLGVAALAGGLLAWFRDAKAAWMPGNIPHSIPLPFKIGGLEASKWTLSMEGSLILIGAGAIMSFRTGWSLLLGAVLTYGVLGPALVDAGVVSVVSYKTIVAWTVWPGAALLVSSGIMSFILDYKSVMRSFRGLSRLFRKKSTDDLDDPVAAVECPDVWFPLGFLVLGPVVVVLMMWLFAVPLWAALIALPLAVAMGFVAARVTGETDVTPTKALGPVTQLVFGAITPGNLGANIMSGNVTGGIGLHAADLLTDLKSGYLLGANPRQQFYAQMFGVVAGAAVVVPAFNLLIPDVSALGSEMWPAPSALVWAGVSKALSGGMIGLPAGTDVAVVVGLVLGAVLAVLEKITPKRLLGFVPSASGLGIAMVVPGFNSISMFLGALMAEVLRRRKPHLADRAIIPVSSGFIAGESLIGILIAVLIVVGVLQK